jgi:hypothetical protein
MKRLRSGLALAGTLLFASALGVSSASAANLLVNPGFESGGGSYTGWFTFGSGVQLSLPGGDNIIRTGVAASKTYGEFAGCPGLPTFSVGGYGQAFTPTVGRVYELSGYSFVSTADPIPGTTTCSRNRMLAKIVFFNATVGGAEISSNEVVIGDGNTVLNQWNAFSVSAPAPAGALRVEALFLFLQPGCDTGSVFVDDVSFDERTPVVTANVLTNPSFSSGLAGWSTFGNTFAQSGAGTVRTPTGSAKMFSTFAPDTPSGLFQSTPATAGNVWELEVHTLTTCLFNDAITGTNDNSVLARIVYRDAAAAEIGSNEAVVLDHTAPLGRWTRHAVTAVAPLGTVTAQAYLLFISPTLQGGSMYVDDVGFRNLGTIDVPASTRPGTVELAQNVPNPFRVSTRIDFVLAQAGRVEVGVYDLAGRRVATLLQGSLEAGPHTVSWDGRTSRGLAAAGLYQYVVRTSAGRQARRMLLLP